MKVLTLFSLSFILSPWSAVSIIRQVLFLGWLLLGLTRPLAWWVKSSPMVWETGVQYQVESYQRLKKWYLMPPCLILSIIRLGSRVKWSNPGNGVEPYSRFCVVAIEKGAFGSPPTKVTDYFLSLGLVFWQRWDDRLYRKIAERFSRLVYQDRFWVVHIPFVRIVQFIVIIYYHYIIIYSLLY